MKPIEDPLGSSPVGSLTRHFLCCRSKNKSANCGCKRELAKSLSQLVALVISHSGRPWINGAPNGVCAKTGSSKKRGFHAAFGAPHIPSE